MGHFGTIRIFHRTETPDWQSAVWSSSLVVCRLYTRESDSLRFETGCMQTLSARESGSLQSRWMSVCSSSLIIMNHNSRHSHDHFQKLQTFADKNSRLSREFTDCKILIVPKLQTEKWLMHICPHVEIREEPL